ncbi:ExbD/TolR family protein [Sulfurimonas marina]|uniref:Biopolymer transporter ExbD n=1 Tax=Sulfurimonas marina TaxID=2590551 RepID=A0A7M1AUB0_9BACT|nr:biopolymer transporter ExbD [Sulfurimonas marina]QOP40999.1 biopolymer transporter ExbD [Sulfurimonas marina]
MLYDWDEKPELNITPLVDVMLVLLAILMVIAPNIIFEENIKLPQGSTTKQISKIPPVHITIDEEQNIQVNKENFLLNGFQDNFYLYANKLDKKATVLISADESLDYGIVMSILAAVKQAGFTEVSLATNG